MLRGNRTQAEDVIVITEKMAWHSGRGRDLAGATLNCLP